MPFDSSSYCSTSAFDAASPILYEIIAALESLNIPVDQVRKVLIVLLGLYRYIAAFIHIYLIKDIAGFFNKKNIFEAYTMLPSEPLCTFSRKNNTTMVQNVYC